MLTRMRTTRMRTVRWMSTVIAGGSLALALPVLAAVHADAAKEMRTAEQHAEYAARAGNIDAVRLHLHHVVNCLVGPKGKGFDAAAGDPCKGEGNGAVHDYKGPRETRAMLRQSLQLARVGLSITNYEAARTVARATELLLAQAAK